ncbi:MAG: lysophospholipid acyltransferase family protein [Planctomycetes bacterium]|nr:lysophospholipid acyltransferase family protein [Planctomycetota bacterium]
MLKSLTDNITFSSSAGRFFLLGLGRTWNIDEVNSRPSREIILGRKENVIFAFWHNRLFFMTYYLATRFIRRGHRVVVFSSYSKDGEIMTRLETKLGASVVRGSSSKRSREGLLSLYRVSKEGHSPAITPDGPRGPKYQVKGGIVFLAQKTGFPIIPLTYSVDKALRLNSWDNFIVPLPFARATVHYGEPVYIPPEVSKPEREKYIKQIENALMVCG